jgi:hypothetical protein
MQQCIMQIFIKKNTRILFVFQIADKKLSLNVLDLFKAADKYALQSLKVFPYHHFFNFNDTNFRSYAKRHSPPLSVMQLRSQTCARCLPPARCTRPT